MNMNNLKKYEVLREVAYGGRALEWFRGEVPKGDEDRGKATNALLEDGHIEKVEDYPERAPHPFRITKSGCDFLADLSVQIKQS